MNDTAFCAALTQERAAPADPLAVHVYAEVVEDLLSSIESMLNTLSEHCTHKATRDDPAEYVPTHEGWAADDLRRAVKAARERLNAEGEA